MKRSQIAALIGVGAVGGVAQAIVIRRDLMPWLARPIDGGRTLGGHSAFGPNKTWRGVAVMMVGSAVGGAVLLPAVQARSTAATGAATGALLGLVYVAAELPNSFVKRRLGVDAGARAERFTGLQYLVDQADSVVGVTIAVPFLFPASARDLALLLLAGTGAHIVFDLVLHATAVKRRPT